MKPKYEIDNEILKKATGCQKQFGCLNDYFPKYGEVMGGIIALLCESKYCGYCLYRFRETTDNPVCMCPVKKEIYRKYKNNPDYILPSQKSTG